MRTRRSAVLVLMLALAAALAAAAAEKGGKDISLTGEVIDSACYIKMGAKGPGHAECATSCGKAGIPLALLEDKTDTVWWITADRDMQSANAKLLPFVAKKVTITGKMFERGGTKLVAMDSVKPAS